MGRGRKGFLFITVVLLAILCFSAFDGRIKETSVGTDIFLTSGEVAALELEKENKNLDSVLLYDGNPLPYDKASDIYYIPQNLESEEWQGKVSSAVGGKIYWVEDLYWEQKAKALREGHMFKAVVISKNWFQELNVIFTGMPVVVIEGRQDRETEEKGNFYLFDTDGQESVHLSCTYHTRGKTSALFEKKGYRFKLYKQDKSCDISLLGLREDNSWILNPLYTDRSKIREALSVDLWNEISPEVPGSRMQYVELFLNQEYRGLYGLMEPIDGKQLSLENGDYLYKWQAREYPGEESFRLAEGNMFCDEIEAKYPNKPVKGMWQPLEEYIHFLENGTLHNNIVIDEENFIDNWLFLQMIQGVDNISKNQFILSRQHNDRIILQKIPWDMNYSWGDLWIEESLIYTIYGGASETLLDITTLNALDEYFGSEIYKRIESRYKELRKGDFFKEELMRQINEKEKILEKSGAFVRDSQRWPECENKFSGGEIEEYIEQRLKYLDQIIPMLENVVKENGS